MKKTTREWVELLEKGGIPAGPIYDISEALSDPQALSREMVVGYDHPKAGKIKTVGFPIKFSGEKFEISNHPPLLGEHNEEILLSLGCTKTEINDLRGKGII